MGFLNESRLICGVQVESFCATGKPSLRGSEASTGTWFPSTMRAQRGSAALMKWVPSARSPSMFLEQPPACPSSTCLRFKSLLSASCTCGASGTRTSSSSQHPPEDIALALCGFCLSVHLVADYSNIFFFLAIRRPGFCVLSVHCCC